MIERHDYTPVALYARVSSERQDVDLSVAAQLRALRDYAEKNDYIVAREYVDEAESGRIANRPEFRKMIDEASRTNAPFREILVWKFSRFTRKREHAVAFKSMLRRKGIRVVSITEQAEDTATGRLLEGIIESVDEFYSENLAQEVLRGMREAASRGFWVGSKVPYGFSKLYVQDGPKKRPTLEPDPATSPIVERIFAMSEAGKGMLDITRTLNGEGIASPAGKVWGKTSIHKVLTNEAYTGTLVWGANAKDGADPVRVEKAFPAIVSKTRFRRVNRQLRRRAPKVVNPRRVGSSFLLSGLVKCKTCNRALTGQYSKSGQFPYYVCQSLMKQGKEACKTPRLAARRFEEMVVTKIRSNILTDGNIRALVKVVDEQMDGVAGDQRKKLQTVEKELADVRRRLDTIYNLVETTEVEMADFTPRIRQHRERQERLEYSADQARAALAQRRNVLDDVNTIAAYAQDMSAFLKESELTERRTFIESFVKEVIVMPDNALMRYTVPMPEDSFLAGGVTEKVALNGSVLASIHVGGPPRVQAVKYVASASPTPSSTSPTPYPESAARAARASPCASGMPTSACSIRRSVRAAPSSETPSLEWAKIPTASRPVSLANCNSDLMMSRAVSSVTSVYTVSRPSATACLTSLDENLRSRIASAIVGMQPLGSRNELGCNSIAASARARAVRSRSGPTPGRKV